MNIYKMRPQHKQRVIAVVLVLFIGLTYWCWPGRRRTMGERTGLETKYKKFYLDGKPLRILSGAVHYFRVVPEYWADRLMKLKSCGLNTVETYVPWNLHEEIKGNYKFDGMLDLRKYILLAKKLGLYVIFRPGPFICSEWDFGGLPSWLLHDPHMRVRSTYQPFMDAVDSYFSQLIPLVADLQYTKGGPIIAVQIENEYGSFSNDINYMEFVKTTMEKYGIVELMFTSDNDMGIDKGSMPGVLVTANFNELHVAEGLFNQIRKTNPEWPLMAMEFWPGWFDHWGEEHHKYSEEKTETVLRYILKNDGSVNFYMFHGGTNFGFMNGANGPPYAPTITSYDYDAPLNERGGLTNKYAKIKEIFEEMIPSEIPHPLPELPSSAHLGTMGYGTVKMTRYMPLDSMLTYVESVHSKEVIPMEFLDINNGGGQGYGFILYRKSVTSGGTLKITGHVRDRAVVLFDGNEEGVIDCYKPDQIVEVKVSKMGMLDILVENLGRVNYADGKSGVLDDQRKGLVEPVNLGDTKLEGWSIYPLEFKKKFLRNIVSSPKWTKFDREFQGPAIFRGTFFIHEESARDTYINMVGWKKGVVFVNGFNLGRYWEKGPQGTLYLPGPLLKKGDNEILVFELHKPNSVVILDNHPVLGS
ncbi:beta-galactosidase-1-like protein 2 [Lingula anatina]|uniref:Beta-galactosidase n=1 Tax=Lingula anatina TaxID=7574 RepID=A0A1S3HLK7_LINAN|nr:beta-galactosidase-1-like protein 2 [Lingula anatina]|eukprot:XP_013386988.1 beta-galactosidase-1-like protein 2 [Lingula anatina]